MNKLTKTKSIEALESFGMKSLSLIRGGNGGETKSESNATTKELPSPPPGS